MNSIEKKHIWASFRDWLTKHRKIVIIVGSIFIFLAAAGSAYFFMVYRPNLAKAPVPETQLPKVEIPKPKYYSPLSGLLVADEAATNQAVTGVMIPNDTYGARPQSGLVDAGVVFEAICEGGITRFLALFQNEIPKVIGPIRSVRMYYLSWAAGFQASIAHVGGNMDVLSELQSGQYRDIDQFSNSDTYWRDETRGMPNNMYTDPTHLDTLNTSLGYVNSKFTPFPKKDGVVATTLTASNISISVSTDQFNSSYVFDPLTNKYARSQAGEPHNDADGRQISPSTVIAMFVDEESLSEPENHEQITTIGSGRAVIFQNGTATESIWTKTGQFDQITFADTAGNPVTLNRGQTWITAVPNGRGDAIWN